MFLFTPLHFTLLHIVYFTSHWLTFAKDERLYSANDTPFKVHRALNFFSPDLSPIRMTKTETKEPLNVESRQNHHVEFKQVHQDKAQNETLNWPTPDLPFRDVSYLYNSDALYRLRRESTRLSFPSHMDEIPFFPCARSYDYSDHPSKLCGTPVFGYTSRVWGSPDLGYTSHRFAPMSEGKSSSFWRQRLARGHSLSAGPSSRRSLW